MQASCSFLSPYAREFPMLLQLWERSVRATHHFLSEADIRFYKPLVRDMLFDAPLWLTKTGQGTAAGFMILQDSKVEALFLDPDVFGQGIGRSMLEHARTLKGPLSVDVNEANHGACVFYERCGFVRTGRSSLDGMGRPFALIHMHQPA